MLQVFAHVALCGLAGSSSSPSVGPFLLQKDTRQSDGKAQSVPPRVPKAKDWAMCLIQLTNNDALDLLFIFLGPFK